MPAIIALRDSMIDKICQIASHSRLLKKAHLLRYPHSLSLRRRPNYTSLQGISDALYLDLFEQPAKIEFFRNLIEPLVQKLSVSDKNFSFDFIAKRFISGMHLPPPLRHTIWMGSLSPKQKDSLYSHGLGDLMRNLDTFQTVKVLLQDAKVANSLETLLFLDMKLYLQDSLLVKLDRASMASSLEVRVPFLDHHVADFVTKLPASFKLKWLKSKYLLKKCGLNILPKSVIQRKKKGFGIPCSEWIRKELYSLFQDVLSVDRIKREGLFNPCFIGKLLEDHLARRHNNGKSLWTLFMFEHWLESYFNGTPAIDDRSPSYESIVPSASLHG